jgi:hypothetical protein
MEKIIRTVEDLDIEVLDIINTNCRMFATLDDFSKHLTAYLGFEVILYENDSDFVDDYKASANFEIENENDLYFDVYYLKDKKGNLYLTEYAIDTAHDFNDTDLILKQF